MSEVRLLEVELAGQRAEPSSSVHRVQLLSRKVKPPASHQLHVRALNALKHSQLRELSL